MSGLSKEKDWAPLSSLGANKSSISSATLSNERGINTSLIALLGPGLNIFSSKSLSPLGSLNLFFLTLPSSSNS